MTVEDEQEQKDNKIIYQLSDGSATASDIEKYVSVSSRTVNNRRKEWTKLGIMEKERNSYNHIISLDNIGIDYPDISKLEEEKNDEE